MKFSKLALFASILTVICGLTAISTSAQTSSSKRKTAAKTSVRAKKVKEKDLHADPDLRSQKTSGRRSDGDENRKPQKGEIKASRKATSQDQERAADEVSEPMASKLVRAKSFTGDLRSIPYSRPAMVDREELEAPNEDEVIVGDPVPLGSGRPEAPTATAPIPLSTFAGLDFTTFGTGFPPDTNGDVGPTYYIQSVNGSIGIYNKSTGVRVVGISLNSFMSAGAFGNLCDTNNSGDPVVLYDSFEDRWIITDFAFATSGGFAVSPSLQCFAASKTGDPVSGGWNFYSTTDADLFNDYGKFAIWPDGVYMSANMFGFGSGGSFSTVRVRALNKAQMYAGAPTVQVVVFNAPAGEFTMLPANARLQTGTPPAGSPNYFSVVWQFTNAVSIYKFHVDWNRISTSTFTGPFISIAPASWGSPPSTVPTSGGNNIDTLALRLMMQNQYTNIGGVESVWNSHTVLGGAAGTAAPRFYQVNVTGGTVAAATTQAVTSTPDTTVNRFMPSLAVDKDGNMLMGYTAASSTLLPALRWAGRLAGDPASTLPQTEVDMQTGTGTQLGNCGGSPCTRWGDYSTMTLDPDGCTFWYTGEYYIATGLNWQNRIGSTRYPTCVSPSPGIIQGTVTSSVTGLPINGANVSLGSRTTTTNASGFYSFASLPPGTYPTDAAAATGYTSSTVANVVVNSGLTTTQDFSLATPAANACPLDTTQADFQTGVPTTVDLTTSAGDVTLVNTPNVDQQSTTLGTSGVGITITTWGGQTFTPAVTGQLTKADINLFCSGCTGTTPNLTLSVRATSGGLPIGADLATATITGFSSGASVYYTGTFASPPTLTAGTVYALAIRPTANPSVGIYALTRSGTSTAGADVYAGGSRVSGATSGTVWSIPTTGGVTTDTGFRTYMQTGFSAAGNLVSGTKDANPVLAGSTSWTTLSWTATTPALTTLQFQVAASNNVNGPFNFVGPDGTAATFFTTSGASLSQFNGNRYLKYKAYLATTNSAVTPTLNDVTICFTNPRVWTGAVSSDWNNPANWSSSGAPGTSDAAIIPATGVTNDPVNTSSVSVASLQLGAGRIVDTGVNTLTVSTCSPSAVTGGSATSFVRGSLTRCVDSTGTYSFPVGTANGYSPVSLNGIVGSGNFNVNPVQAFLTGTNTAQSIQRNWGLTRVSGPTSTNITLTYLDADVPGGANEAGFNFIRRSSGVNAAFPPTTIDTAANTFTLNNVAAFSDWTLGNNSAPTAAGVSIAGRVISADGRGVRNANVTLRDASGNLRTAITSSFGYYRFDDVAVGQTYVCSVRSKRYQFSPKVVSLVDELTGLDFVAEP
jgi:hypothetical protein